MSWGSWSEFWTMGGYAFYVWGSYAVALMFIIAEVLLLRARRRTAMDALNKREARSHETTT